MSQGKPTDLRLNWPRFWTNVTKEGWPSPVVRRSLNSSHLSDLLKLSFKYQSLLREMIFFNKEIVHGQTAKKNSHILHTMTSWSGCSYPENSWKDRARLACSQTLYFLFKVRRARVIKYKPQGIYWPRSQGGSGEGRIIFLSRSPRSFSRARFARRCFRKERKEK